MTQVIERELFLATLTAVEPGLSTRDVVEQANCFVFRDGRVFTFNDELACSHKIGIDFEGAIESEVLKGILEKLKESTLNVLHTDSSLVLKGRGRKVELTKHAEIHLPLDTLEVPTKWKKLPSNFMDAIDFVQDCVSRDEARYPLSCVHIHPEYMEAFDNDQFARFNINSGFRREHLVRQPSLREVLSAGVTKFSEGKEWLHFKNDEELMLSCRRYKDAYEDLTGVYNAKGKNVELPKGLGEAAERAEILAKKNAYRGMIQIDLTSERIVIRGQSDSGIYTERKKVNWKSEPISFMVPPRLMVQLIKRHNKCQMTEKIIRIEFGDGPEGVFVASMMPLSEINKRKE